MTEHSHHKSAVTFCHGCKRLTFYFAFAHGRTHTQPVRILMKAMIDASRAAQLLGMSRERTVRLILTGVLKGVRQNGRWLVEMDSVTRALRERQGEHATGTV